ncbi:hypothetical protein BJ742DRAFT_231209 [Cladochytrium replicatum]|nr:hypothetical protein BJ742DRAFT_231209 [Cladochytrium replicatum]
MPNYWVVRCCDCNLHSIQQEKKVQMWMCVVCGTKQQLQNIFFSSCVASECRARVQALNDKRWNSDDLNSPTVSTSHVPNIKPKVKAYPQITPPDLQRTWIRPTNSNSSNSDEDNAKRHILKTMCAAYQEEEYEGGFLEESQSVAGAPKSQSGRKRKNATEESGANASGFHAASRSTKMGPSEHLGNIPPTNRKRVLGIAAMPLRDQQKKQLHGGAAANQNKAESIPVRGRNASNQDSQVIAIESSIDSLSEERYQNLFHGKAQIESHLGNLDKKLPALRSQNFSKEAKHLKLAWYMDGESVENDHRETSAESQSQEPSHQPDIRSQTESIWPDVANKPAMLNQSVCKLAKQSKWAWYMDGENDE